MHLGGLLFHCFVFSWQTGETIAGFPICPSGFYLQKYKICATFVLFIVHKVQ